MVAKYNRCVNYERSSNYWVHGTRHIPLKEVDTDENAKRLTKDAMVVAKIYNLLANEK